MGWSLMGMGNRGSAPSTTPYAVYGSCSGPSTKYMDQLEKQWAKENRSKEISQAIEKIESDILQNKLEKLDLTDLKKYDKNNFNDMADIDRRALISFITKLLKFNHSIKTLSYAWLSSNVLDDKIAAELASALESNTSITEINLSHTYIGNEGADAIARSLEKNKTVTKINLYQFWTHITDAKIHERVEALTKCNEHKLR